MKLSTAYLIVIIFLSAQFLLTEKSNAQDKGIYLGGSLQGAAWNIPDQDVDTESGAGISLEFGYNFNTNFALFLGLDGANINPDVGDNYGLGHFDIGAEGRIGNSESKFRPFGRISYLGMAAVQNNQSGDVEISGAGFGLGAGLYYYLTDNLALKTGFTKSWVNISEVKIGSESVSVDENAESSRFNLGISYHY